MTELAEFDRLLKDAMGLDVSSIGASALERAVQERQRACKADSPTQYLAHVRSSGAELQSLIEAIVVPETWFFRDHAAFAALVRFVREEWMPFHPDRSLRVLSVPCSTGEEPYSIAMALLDANVPPRRFQVDAIDICGRSLDHARRGVYRKSSFRGDAMTYCERHVEPVTGGHALSDAVKQQVKFTQANLLDTAFSLGAGQYDIVFCRNLLIYFDRETQDRAAAILERSLTPTGLLFVGSSETPVFLGRAFTPANIPMAFALRKGRRETKPKRPAVISTVRPALAPPVRAVVPAPAADPVRHSSPAPLDEALKMADQGRFTEAWRSCEEHLRRNGPTADAFYVLGLVRDALGNADDAAACYRKALYLHPAHREAVVHLALLLEKQGNSSEAQALMNRAKRLSAPRM
jgi:chemotaxis protein methyltransferase WspC